MQKMGPTYGEECDETVISYNTIPSQNQVLP